MRLITVQSCNSANVQFNLFRTVAFSHFGQIDDSGELCVPREPLKSPVEQKKRVTLNNRGSASHACRPAIVTELSVWPEQWF